MTIDEVEIEVYESPATGSWHWKIMSSPYNVVGRGCVLSGSRWGRKRAIYYARRDARTWMKKSNKKARPGGGTHRETVTLDGRPSRTQLERKIAELEADVLDN